MTETLAVRAGRRTVEIPRPAKVLFPSDGLTKADLATYYRDIAPVMVPLVRGRPLSIERFPDGIASRKLFQQHVPKHFPDWIARATVPKRGGTVEHVVADDAATLVYLAGQAAITLHMWLSDMRAPEHPDQIVFDLDPTGCEWRQITDVAFRVRDLLGEVGLPSYVKTSGSRGLHVHVPLDRSADFEEARAFADRVGEILATADPDTITLEARKVNRRACLFFDTGRNAYAQTAVAPYSVRARDGAPCAVPLSWDEVRARAVRPDGFGMRETVERVARRPDPWAGMNRRRCSLKRAWRALDRVSV